MNAPVGPRRNTAFRGNKAWLPCKPCVQCGRAMTWRRAWAKNWVEVKFCSDRCRQHPRIRDDAPRVLQDLEVL